MNIELIINNKIVEHDTEITGCKNMLPELQKEAKIALDKKKHDVALYAQKIMIIKDKLAFHKACKATLRDLLEEIREL